MAAACQRSHTQPRGDPPCRRIQPRNTGWPRWLRRLGVYLRPRVLIVLLLGFSAGSAAGSVRRDAARVDGRPRRRSRHHRSAVACRTAVHDQVPLGAGGRCARRAVAVRAAGPPARLAGGLAAAADGGDPVSRHARSGGGAAGGGSRRAAGRLRLGDAGHRHRRLPGREPGAGRAGGRHGELRRGLSHRHAGVGRGRDRADGLAGDARPRQDGGVADRLRGRRCAGAGGSCGGAARPRAAARVQPQPWRPTDRRLWRASRARRRRVRRFPVARCGAGRAGLRDPLQAVRCAGRRHDRAVRAVARLRQGHLRRDREGRGPGGAADRRLCRRRRRQGPAAGHGAVARRHPADDLQPGLRVARTGSRRAPGR